MFEEIPAPPAPPSQRTAIRAFAIIFASFLILLVVALVRWSGHPLSVTRKIISAQFVLSLVLSGVFLLTAKSVTHENNRKRLWALFLVIMIIQVFIDVLQ